MNFLPLLIIGILCHNAVWGQFRGYPPVPVWSDTPKGLIPHGWETVSESYGDLNGDGLGDVALAVGSPDSVPGDQWTTYYPRMLIIAFFDPDEGRYRVVNAQVNILNPPNRTFTHNKFVSLSADRAGNLSLFFELVWSGGTYHTTEASLTFRYTDSVFRLIRHETNHVGHHTGIKVDITADYLRGRYRKEELKTQGGRERRSVTSGKLDNKILTFSDITLLNLPHGVVMTK